MQENNSEKEKNTPEKKSGKKYLKDLATNVIQNTDNVPILPAYLGGEDFIPMASVNFSGIDQNLFSKYLMDNTVKINPENINLSPSFFQTQIFNDEKENLQSEIAEQRKKVNDLLKEIKDKKVDLSEKDRLIENLNGSISNLRKKEKLSFLLERVNEDAQKLLLENQEFRELFENKTPNNVVVMAIDIRRSTELMLKAKSPEAFSVFITTLCSKLSEIIKKYYGVFDKFTGDGVLAFFPDFYSGEDAILLAMAAAEECHLFFHQHYKDSRKCFSSVIRDIGLGIGIDCGKAHLVNISGGLTVVGTPVVYACRMSGAKAGQTLLNQPAFEAAYPKYAEFYKFEESDLDIKHEGTVLAYKSSPNTEKPPIKKPNWENYLSGDE